MPLSQGARVLNRRRFIVGAALIAAAVSYLVYAGIRTTSMYYFELSEFVARRDALLGETLRVKGWVKQGSVSWDAHTNELAFELATKRSEERRVGKECRSRWSPYQEKKNWKIR